MKKRCGFFYIALLALLTLSELAEARSVYLNGVDISGAINQELSNVDIHINEKGDLFISAPHYEVHEEGPFLPMKGNQKKTLRQMEHKPPQELPSKPHSELSTGETTANSALREESSGGGNDHKRDPSSSAPLESSENGGQLPNAQAAPQDGSKAGSKLPR